ncbi:MAG: hypothetical protein JWO95_1239 [Verrucomicrobiales bacterium]|nr:hypothetical protein [Verrucomicrobiales bacterium]
MQHRVLLSLQIGPIMKTLRTFVLVLTLLPIPTFASVVAHWSADGNASDSVSGTSSASAIAYTAGHTGQAFDLTGGTSVDFGSAFANFGTADFTVEFWIRTTSTGTQAILCKRPICDAYNMIDFRLWPGGAIRFEVSESPYCYGFALGGHVNDGVYHHVVGARKGTGILLYIDGQLVSTGSDPFPASVSSSSPLLIGRGPCSVDGTAGFVGQLDEITLYDEALTPDGVYISFAPNNLSIVTQPESKRIFQGSSATFSASAVGPGSITYQWRFNGANIPGATSTSLTITDAKTTDAGSYTLFASNSTNSTTSLAAVLQVNQAHTSTTLQPIAWWKAEGDGTDSAGVFDATQINCEFTSGVVGQSFFFRNGETAQFPPEAGKFGTGNFSVSFWFKAGAALYALVEKRPFYDDETMRQLSAEWGDVRFQLAETPDNVADIYAPYPLDNQLHHVVGVRDGINVFLYIDGILAGTTTTTTPVNVSSDAPILLGDDMRHEIGLGNLTGQIDELQLFDQALSADQVFGLYSPSHGVAIAQQPVDTIAVVGDSATLSINAISGSPLLYQWRKNGTNIADATDSSFTINTTLEADSGTYDVVLTDVSSATTTSAAADLIVIPLNGISIADVIARWPGEGNGNDSTGAGHDATACTTSFGPGVIGQAFYFDGTGAQTVNFGNQTLNFDTNDFTVSFYLKASQTGHRIMILGKRSVCDDNNMFDFRVMANGQVIYEVGDHHGFGGMAIGGHVDGNWHHWAGVRKGTEQFLYEDGVLVGQTSLPYAPNASSSVDFQFGVDPCMGVDDTTPLLGAIDEVEAYSRALSRIEVFALSHPAALAPRITQQPVDLSAALGEKQAFKVTATGRGPFFYQWKLNGVDIAGATKSTLALGTITGNKAGQYSVEVTTQFGAVISKVATLNIVLSPGTYNGLFLSDDGSDDTTGGFTLTLNRSKVFSGVLLQHGLRYAFTGRMPDKGTNLPVAGRFNLNLRPIMSGDYDTIHGSVESSKGRSMLHSRHTRPTYLGLAPQRGKHTLALPTAAGDAASPNGIGFGNVTVANNGNVTLSSIFADDTSTLSSSTLTKNGEWPVYIPLYRGAGSVAGWLNMSNTVSGSCTGVLRWNKTATYGKYHPKPFHTKVPVTGSTFTIPTAGVGVNLTDASVILKSGSQDLQVTQTGGMSGSTVTFDGSNGSATFIPSTGRFTGRHYDPNTRVLAPIKGVVLQQQQFASGYFLVTTNSGLLLMEKK